MRVSHVIGGVAAALLTLPVACMAAPEGLSLRQAVDEALNNNPTVAAGRLSAEAARQAAVGARALTNPELSVSPTVVGTAGSDSALFFSQPLEINGSRRVRGRIASSQAEAASYEAVATRRNLVLQVNSGYWELVRAQKLVELDRANLEYLDQIRAAVQKQLDAGAVPGMQLVKTEVELARARQELAQTELGLAQAKAELNSLLNRPKNADLTASDQLVFTPISIDRSRLGALALARPEIATSKAQLAAARGEISAAKLRRVPDLAVQARQESFDSDTDRGAALAVTLPVLDWGSAKADKRRAETEAQSRERLLQATTNEVGLQVEQAALQVETSSKVIQEYETGILGKSEELATAARKGYEKGAISYLEVLEAQRTLRATRTEYIRALADYAKALAQLEWASGSDLTGLSQPEVKG